MLLIARAGTAGSIARAVLRKCTVVLEKLLWLGDAVRYKLGVTERLAVLIGIRRVKAKSVKDYCPSSKHAFVCAVPLLQIAYLRRRDLPRAVLPSGHL